MASEPRPRSGRVTESGSAITELPPKAVFEREAYLVARGVRPLAQVGHYRANTAPEDLRNHLLRFAESGIVPYVIQRTDGAVDFGYAAEPWVVCLYRWLLNCRDVVPPRHYQQILGLIFGYSPTAIQNNDNLTAIIAEGRHGHL